MLHRIKTLRVQSELMAAFFKMTGTTAYRVTGMPDDARVVDAAFDWRRDHVVLLIESSEFPEVPDGHDAPDLDLKAAQVFGPTLAVSLN